MSTHTTRDATRRRNSPKPLPLMAWYVGSLFLVFVFFWGVSTWLRSMNSQRVAIPDERKAAAELLARKLSGPGYFRVPPGGTRDAAGVTVETATEPHVSTSAARSQVAEIVKARAMSAGQEAKVQALIDQLAEKPSSRVVGEDHVNLLRLNLALDALP
jgi:hypothetical protein